MGPLDRLKGGDRHPSIVPLEATKKGALGFWSVFLIVFDCFWCILGMCLCVFGVSFLAVHKKKLCDMWVT